MSSPSGERIPPDTIPASEPHPDQFQAENTKNADHSETSERNMAFSDVESIETNEDVGEDQDRPDSTDLMFEKKHVQKSRTQSIQSVLSTASLKSLKQQLSVNNLTSNQPRSSSIISTTSNFNNSKNFQSFIQAPVLSSITDLKNNDNIEIGQRLPFVDKKEDNEGARATATSAGGSSKVASDEDDDGLWQQQKLTINALKKLSLSPQPIYNADNDSDHIRSTVVRKTSAAKIPVLEKIVEPYKPAEVDLSTFASLTRQPKVEKLQSTQSPPQADDTSDASQQKNTEEEEDQRDLDAADPQKNVQEAMSLESRHDANLTQPASISNSSSTSGASTGSQLSRQSNNSASVLSAQAAYHKELQETHQLRNIRPNSMNNKIPAAVIPPQDMNIRRSLSSHLVGGKVNSSNGNGSLIEGKSPTKDSHHSMKHLQQIKGFRNPMYVPAVLRMSGINKNGPNGYSIDTSNENTSKATGSDKMTSVDNINSNNNHNHNNNNNNHQTDSHHHNNNNSNNSYINSNNNINKNSNRSNRGANTNDNGSNNNEIDADSSQIDNGIDRTNGDLTNSGQSSQSSVASIESNESTVNSMSPRVSSGKYEDISRSAPTRRHWLKDEAVFKCGIRSCNKHFNFFERRHHCRKCGGIYCNEHTSHYLYINHLAQFTTGGRGTLSKVCDYCIGEYNEFIKNEFGVDVHSTGQRSARKTKSSVPLSPSKRHPKAPSHRQPGDAGSNSSNSNYNDTAMVDKLGTLPSGISTIHSVKKDGATRSDQLVGSVPANWSWSSF
ncbi:hypothetical protein CLIB1423_02S11034 [[Candida] railenensis]|uniref:FYVE-type domain-containing protein n=1 Tax=[Candida] railenensis TaxID=45579 RepID=A0A9P0VX27_9ASCO|nr:hypothetical protein CLIB1423_02S11034 [[Candida] railenensis]